MTPTKNTNVAMPSNRQMDELMSDCTFSKKVSVACADATMGSKRRPAPMALYFNVFIIYLMFLLNLIIKIMLSTLLFFSRQKARYTTFLYYFRVQLLLYHKQE